MKREEL